MLRPVWLNFSHGHRKAVSISSDPTNRRVWMQRFCGAIHHGSFHESNRRDRWVLSLVRSAVHQREDPCLFSTIVERMESPDFVHATHAVECIQILCVAGCKFARLEIAAAQICIVKCVRTLAREKMKTQPAATGRGYALGFSKKGDKQQKNEIRVHLRL